MRGYPQHVNTIADFKLLLSIPEFWQRATDDLNLILNTDDDQATLATELIHPDKPHGPWKTKTIDNPYPLFKQKGFSSKQEIHNLIKLYPVEPKPKGKP